METRTLGRTGIEVSALGFGGWAIGGNEHGNSLGPTDDRDSRAAIEAALEAGVTFFDTADVYGFGHSERLLGEALTALGRRARVVIATKVGADFTDPSNIRNHYDPEYVRAALGRSLERLRVERVDLLQLHDPPAAVISDPAVHEALRRVKEEGLARAVGVTLHHTPEAVAAVAAGAYDTLQITLNVSNQWVANRILGPAAAAGIGVIAREPLAQGYLTGKYGPDHAFPPGDVRAGWPAAHRAWLAELAGRMRAYFHERRKLDRPLAAIALQFALQTAGVSTVIASMKTPAQVAQNLLATTLPPLGEAEMRWLRE
jgi:aryl-alcohol dehydrogenase-like predicted oxidoreductase